MANWYDTDPDKANEVLGNINSERRKRGLADLDAAGVESAKNALGGDTFDPGKLNTYYANESANNPSNTETEPNSWPVSVEKGKPNQIAPGAPGYQPGFSPTNPEQPTNIGVVTNGGPNGTEFYEHPNGPLQPGETWTPPSNKTITPTSGPTPTPSPTPTNPLPPEVLGGLGRPLPQQTSSGTTTPAPTTLASAVTRGGTDLSGQAGELFNQLRDRARQSLQVSRDTPVIRDQVDAVRAEQERGGRQYLSGLAEKAGAGANIGAETRASSEKIAQNTSAFQAGLMAQEIAARRTEIQNALAGAQGLLSQQQQMQLQEELASLQTAEQQYEFQSGQGENARQFDTSNATGREQFLASLMNNRDQFGRTLQQQGYQFDTGQANDLLKNTRSLTLQEALAQLAMAQRAYEFDTTERRLNSPLAQ